MLGLTPWRERWELDHFRSEMDNLFDRFFDLAPFSRLRGAGDWMPVVDVTETGKEVVVQAELPGMEAKDIDISLNGKVLTLKGERKQVKEDKDKNYHRIERRYGSFSRSIELPADVEADKVEAKYKDGVLKISLTKTKEQSVKKVEVKES